MLGADLDSLVEASGVEVTTDGERVAVDPPSARQVGAAAYANPLNVQALDAAVALDLTGLLQLPLDTATGLVGQYGQADSDGLTPGVPTGVAAGAAGFVTDTGGIGLEPANGYPELATVDLRTLVASINPAVADLLGNVTDVSLGVGAVAGRAAVDGCDALWSGDTTTALVREYLAADLETRIASPTVGALLTGVNGLVDSTETTLNGLIGNQAVTQGIASGVLTLLNGVLNTPLLSLGSVHVEALSATIDLAPVRAQLSTPFSDSGGVLTVDPAGGTVTVDTAALLQQAYPGQYGQGLNGLPPNTNLPADPAIVNALTSSLTTVLSEWLTRVETSLVQAIDNTRITATLKVDLRARLLAITPFTDVGHIAVSVDGTLAQLRVNAPGTVHTELKLLSGLLGALTDLLTKGLLKPVIDLLLSTLIGGVGGIIGGAVDGVLPAVSGLPTRLNGLTSPIVTLVSNLYSRLFVDGVVSVVANAQNDPTAGSAEPADWSSLEEGRYDVAALRVGVLDAAGQAGVRLYLGRGSVGPICAVGAPGCAGR
ncbi:choice-of-anchor G family protein [Microbacterium sp. KNMS]